MEEKNKPIQDLNIKDIVKIYNSVGAIPSIQRGLVWNSIRAEVLWDSLMRGIPIGTLSIRTKDGVREILDGQQRACTINMAFTEFPNNSSKIEEKNKSILWIDLGMSSALTENEQGKTTISERKYIFRVTTPAHPWGYRLSDNETKTSTFSFSEQKEFVNQLNNKWEKSSNKGARPYPYELWPGKSKLPIPFNIVYDFVTKSTEGHSYDDFLKHLLNYKGTNWYEHFKEKLYGSEIAKKLWNEISNAIKNVDNLTIFATNASDVKAEDFETYFRRMNKSGVVPSDEDIKYSMIKANVEDLKKLDEISEGLTNPARLASIVLRYSLSSMEGDKWINDVTIEDVKKLSKETYNRISETVQRFCQIRNIIDTKTSEVLPYHRIRFANFSKGDIYLLLMRLAEKDISCINLSGLATLILWFSVNPSGTVKTIWESTLTNGKPLNADAIREGIWKAASKGLLLLPPKISDFEKIKNMIYRLPKQFHNCFDMCTEITNFIDSGERIAQLERIWNGFNGRDGGRDILLLCCKEYIEDVFKGYDLSEPEWKEQNRPWDYDHILPKSWLRGIAYRNIPSNEISFYSLCHKMLWSIGNSCPLPFSQNRSNSNNGPEEYYPNTTGREDSANVLVDNSIVSLFKLNGSKYIDVVEDDNYELAQNFLKGTADRLYNLYNKWFNNCEIGKLLNISDYCLRNEKCPSLLLSVREVLKGKYVDSEIKCVYVARDKMQYDIDLDEPIEWAKGLNGWKSCGVIRQFKNSNEKCFIAVSSDGNTIEIGIRRHPERSQILDKNDWYWTYNNVPLHKSFRFDDNEHKQKSIEDITLECIELFEDFKAKFTAD